MEFIITIPSYRRADLIASKGYTLLTLNEAGYAPTLFVRDEEYEAYSALSKNFYLDIQTLPTTVCNIGTTRNAVLDYCKNNGIEKMLMFNDDLKFAHRDTVPGRLIPNEPSDTIELIKLMIKECTEEYPLVGPRIRAFANNCSEEISINQRVIYAWALHVPTCITNDWQYVYPNAMEDFHMQLTILHAGYGTKTFNRFTVDGVGKSGGCRTTLTAERQSEAAFQLQNDFPDCVTVRPKISKFIDEPYYDVTIYFSKIRRQ